MYKKEAASKIKQQFWKTFGQYIGHTPSADGIKINWVNYKTGIRHLYFKMEAGNKAAWIFIEIVHPDAGIRRLMYDQFLRLRRALESETGELWEWQPETYNGSGQPTATIGAAISGVSVFKEEDWLAIISFLRPRMIALDAFWSNAQYSFDIFR